LQEKGEAFVVVENEDLTWMHTANFWRVRDVFHGNKRSIVYLRALSHR
jgi:hypothetical protein